MTTPNTAVNNCNQCSEALVWQDGLYHCESCDISYKKISFCPDCEHELEKLQACGATNYFCKACNSLKSKSRVRHEFNAV